MSEFAGHHRCGAHDRWRQPPRSALKGAVVAGSRRAPVGADAGAALVETAVVLTLVMVLVSGVVGVSSAASSAAGLERAVSAALREVTAVGGGDSDLAVLARVSAYVAAQPGLDVERIVVFNATAARGVVPRSCATLPLDGASPAGIAGTCNVFGPAHLAALDSQAVPAPGCGPQSWEQWWCPTQRQRNRPDPDRVGIHVAVTHTPGPLLVSVPGADRLSATAVATLDPDDSLDG